MAHRKTVTTVIHQALEDLQIGFMSLTDYTRKVRGGKVEGKPLLCDGQTFHDRCPEHPLANTRFARIAAADHLLAHARTHAALFTPDVLARIHQALFDCCSATRLALVDTLFLLGHRESADPLEALIAQERNHRLLGTSATVLRHARAVLGRCTPFSADPFATDSACLTVLSQDIEFICALQSLADLYEVRLYQGRGIIDLIAQPSIMQIVDRSACTDEDWAPYLAYLEQVVQGGDSDDIPLLVFGREAGEESPAWEMGLLINKPAGTVHFLALQDLDQMVADVDALIVK